jgi:hypothetical protein
MNEATTSYTFEDLAYIDGVGQYHAGTSLLAFDPAALSAKQWENMDRISDGARQDYAIAILHGDAETIRQLERDID